MNKLPALWAVLLASCADSHPIVPISAGSTDAAAIEGMLDLARGGPTDSLRTRLDSMARTIQEPELRSRTLAAVEEIVAAATLHWRVDGLVKEVTDLGGKATFEPGGPAWMRALTGDGPMQVFSRLIGVTLYGGVNPHSKDYRLNTRINDDWVDRLAGLPDLRALDLENTDVRGPGLQAVGTLRTLESLNLTLCPVTDEPLAALSALTRLKVLGLASTKVTGAGMKHLQELKKLENLNLHNTPVNDAGLESIGKMSSLVRLEIVHTQFTDVGARSLAGLVNLERLQLGSRKATGASLSLLRELPKLRELEVHDGMMAPEGFRNVAAIKSLRVLRAYGGSGGDESVRTLGGHPQLETLVLESLGVTDAGLATLSSVPSLRKLVLHESKVTEAAVSRLRAGSPSLEITR